MTKTCICDQRNVQHTICVQYLTALNASQGFARLHVLQLPFRFSRFFHVIVSDGLHPCPTTSRTSFACRDCSVRCADLLLLTCHISTAALLRKALRASGCLALRQRCS